MGLIQINALAKINIRANKGRSLLTMLGIIIGISSVITIMSVGAGFKNEMNKQYARYNNPKKAPASSFNYENQRNNIDFDKLEEELIAPKKFNSDN